MGDGDERRARAKRWGLFRLALGTLQIVAAMNTVLSLAVYGANQLTIASAIVAMALTLASVLVFRVFRLDGGVTSGKED